MRMSRSLRHFHRTALDALHKGPRREEDRPLVDNSSVTSYIGIDKRDGLVSIGKQLLQSPLLFLLLAC